MASGIKINEEKATKLWEDGLLDRDIARILKCRESSIWNWRKKRGMSSNKNVFNQKEVRNTLMISENYVFNIGMDINGHQFILTITKYVDSKMVIVNTLTGEEAASLYEKMTDTKLERGNKNV